MLSFNRYMVECEFQIPSFCLVCLYCFNRYMVECELLTSPDTSAGIIVLIDTWWNVNLFAGIRFLLAGLSFNRYMVECEFIEDEIDRSRDLCFNRYVVECELAQGLVGCIGYAGF